MIKFPPLVLPGQCELVITGTPNSVPPITVMPGNAGRSADVLFRLSASAVAGFMMSTGAVQGISAVVNF